MTAIDLDVAIIGAGLSGIDAGYHIQTSTNLDYQIFDARPEIGGTWSIFTYPGVRSDVDIFSYSFPFRPYTGKEAVAEGWQIKQYFKDVAREFGIDKHMQFSHKVDSASWSSAEHCWTLHMRVLNEDGSTREQKTVKARFLFSGAGYFNHTKGYFPELPGSSDFQGPIIYPQFWPKDLDYTNKKVVIIGSGATTGTLFPNMAKQIGSGSVTVLQRSPSYYISISKYRPMINFFRSWFPKSAHWFIRKYYGTLDFIRFAAYRTFPNVARRYLKWHVESMLPKEVPFDPHFKPRCTYHSFSIALLHSSSAH